MTHHTTHRLLPLLSLGLALAACGGRDPAPTPLPVEPVERVVDVQIDPSEVTLEVGETVTLAALVTTESVEPALGARALAAANDPEVTWASFSSHVAAVAADGTVTAVAPGSSLVTATAGGITAQATVTVRDPVVAPPPIASVEVFPATFWLEVGQTRALQAVAFDASGGVVSGAELTWSSLDPYVAIVGEDGVVTALSAGQATLEVSAGDVTATAEVTVTNVTDPGPGTVARVELSETVLALAEGDVRVLTATPVDAVGAPVTGLAVRWQTSDEGTVYVTPGGEVRAVRAGAAAVTATVHGKVATANVTVTLELDSDLFFEAFSAAAGKYEWRSRDVRDAAASDVVVMAGGAVEGRPVPSPAGDRIAFTMNSGLNPAHQLRVVDLRRQTILGPRPPWRRPRRRVVLGRRAPRVRAPDAGDRARRLDRPRGRLGRPEPDRLARRGLERDPADLGARGDGQARLHPHARRRLQPLDRRRRRREPHPAHERPRRRRSGLVARRQLDRLPALLDRDLRRPVLRVAHRRHPAQPGRPHRHPGPPGVVARRRDGRVRRRPRPRDGPQGRFARREAHLRRRGHRGDAAGVAEEAVGSHSWE
ncbi:MAG: Ig-like domain-containing protein [Anaeromyxobacteraceae bacterium]